MSRISRSSACRHSFRSGRSDTGALVAEFQSLGFRSIVCCANGDAYLDASHVGAELDARFVKALPANVDPCGENGEYHSFTFAGPIFREPLAVVVGEKVYRPIEQTHPGACVLPVPGDVAARPVTGDSGSGDLIEAEP